MRFSLASLGLLLAAALSPAIAAPFEDDLKAARNKDAPAPLHARGVSGSTRHSTTCSGTPGAGSTGTRSTGTGSTGTGSTGTGSSSSASTSTKAAAIPTELIIIALKGEDEYLPNGKTKWLTYFALHGKDPDWCNGANTTRTLKQDDNTSEPPSMDYEPGDGDAFLNGCKYDYYKYTFTCGNWKANCDQTRSPDDLGFMQNGKFRQTCDGLSVKEFIVCKPESDSHSPSLPTSATGAKTATTASATKTKTGVTEPQYTAACTQGMRNATSWKDMNMKQFIRDEANAIPESFDGTFIDWLASRTGGVESFSCKFNTADNEPCEYTLDPKTCTQGSNPRYHFAIQAAINLHTWVTGITSSLRDGRNQFGGTSSSITHDFIPTKLPPPNMTWIAVLVAGVLGALSGLSAAWIAAVPAVETGALVTSGLSGAGGGVISIGNGIKNGVMSSATDVIQNELDALSDVEDFVSKQMNAMIESITYWGNNVTQGKAKNDQKSHTYYQNDPKGLAYTLEDGLFASDDMGANKTYALNSDVLRTTWSGAIGFLWQRQEVFIAKLSSKMEDQKHVHEPCSDDFQLKADNKRPLVRVCDGDTAYFFVIKATASGKTQNWPEVNGADDKTLKQYDLDLLTLAKGALWTQNKFGFSANFGNSTTDAITDLYMNTDSPGKLPEHVFNTVPVCDLDWLKHNGPYPWNGKKHYGGLDGPGSELLMFRQLVTDGCGSMEVTIDGKTQSWPYSDFKKHSVSMDEQRLDDD